MAVILEMEEMQGTVPRFLYKVESMKNPKHNEG